MVCIQRKKDAKVLLIKHLQCTSLTFIFLDFSYPLKMVDYKWWVRSYSK